MLDSKGPEDGVAPILVNHQQSAEWNWKDLAQKLYAYDRALREWFSLDLPPFVIRFGRLHRSRYGHFRAGCNEFAIAGEIAINIRYVHLLPFWEIIGTLHHEQLHLWQHIHGRPGKGNYHNRQFQRRANESGLIVDSGGHTNYDPNGRFFIFLKEHGIEAPVLPAAADSVRTHAMRTPGNSKLKRWSCGCTNVWAAVAGVNVKCLRCDQPFTKGSLATGASVDG